MIVPMSKPNFETRIHPQIDAVAINLRNAVASHDENIKYLASGPRHLFSDWPVTEVPEVAAGLYSIWDENQFVYIGMSGRSATPEELERRRLIGKTFGLFNRLAAHASGRRSGDQFCVYVADVFVLPQLTAGQIRDISKRYITFDSLVKAYVHDHLSFRFMETVDGVTALRLEAEIKAGSLGAKPLLNPTP